MRTNRGNDGNGRMGGADDGKGRRIDKMTGWEDELRELREVRTNTGNVGTGDERMGRILKEYKILICPSICKILQNCN